MTVTNQSFVNNINRLFEEYKIDDFFVVCRSPEDANDYLTAFSSPPDNLQPLINNVNASQGYVAKNHLIKGGS